MNRINDTLEQNPIIAAVTDIGFDAALDSPAKIIFYLKSSILTVSERIATAHRNDKLIFVHIDLADGIACDREGICYLKQLGVDGIISTRVRMIKLAREFGLLTVQRFFAYDSQGLESIKDMIESASPDLMEIMPGVILKVIKRFSNGSIPVIAGGLIETKAEVTSAISNGAIAVSTGKRELWSI